VTRMSNRAPEIAGIALLALHNVAVHRVLTPPGDALLNLAAAGGLCALAVGTGATAADLGMTARAAPAGLRLGAVAGLAAAGAVAAGARWAPARRLFADERIVAARTGEAVYNVALRIPLATALGEEVLFRGALLALLRRGRATTEAVALTSLLFGAWHLLPAFDGLTRRSGRAPVDGARPRPSGNAPRWSGARRRAARVAGHALATAGAGTALAWLRLRSGSVAAPIVVHATVNATGYLATRRADARAPLRPS
jgi:uncharacterized protein